MVDSNNVVNSGFSTNITGSALSMITSLDKQFYMALADEDGEDYNLLRTIIESVFNVMLGLPGVDQIKLQSKHVLWVKRINYFMRLFGSDLGNRNPGVGRVVMRVSFLQFYNDLKRYQRDSGLYNEPESSNIDRWKPSEVVGGVITWKKKMIKE
jgi:hypothetical protein